MATMAERKAFIDRIGTVAKQVCEERGYGNAQLWTCIAQACCESGYGKSTLMSKGHAFFGIKATKSWKGLVYSAKTKECYDGSTYTTITDCFRAYATDKESIEDYFNLIEGKRYSQSLSATSVKDCITIIKNGGYATSPVYIKTITDIFEFNRTFITNWTVGAITSSQSVVPTEFEEVDYEKLADEVIAGKYGNGSTRKMLLGAYYGKVQAIVDYRLKPEKFEEMADKVIAGKYGNGNIRRQLLGDYYEIVQKIVNERLGKK